MTFLAVLSTIALIVLAFIAFCIAIALDVLVDIGKSLKRIADAHESPTDHQGFR